MLQVKAEVGEGMLSSRLQRLASLRPHLLPPIHPHMGMTLLINTVRSLVILCLRTTKGCTNGGVSEDAVAVVQVILETRPTLHRLISLCDGLDGD